ncbi:MAG: glycine cleavage system aminomethyltransferase GcvT, partial [Chloroflexi bacterium]|nr:glycine cleavage system aminomethyltransferase GcvT [Chloroflexota bacterium]
RSSAGMFDVSHMGRIEAVGSSVAPFFQWIIAGDVRKLFPGKGMYSVICNEDGGILDDVILYCLGQDHYYLVCNASNRAAVLEALRQAQYDFMETGFEDLTQRTGMIALQGPEAARRLGELGDDGPHLAAELHWRGWV